MKLIKPDIFFGSSNLIFFENLLKIFNIKKNFIFIEKFNDGELKINLLKNNLNKIVFLMQSFSGFIHDNLIEFLLILDLIKRNFINNVYAIIPYFCYSRQDNFFEKISPISIKAIINILDNCKIKKIITIDPHSKNFNCFSTTFVKILKTTSLIVNDIIKNNIKSEIIISPDIGGVDRSKNLANYLNLELIIIDKRRPIFGKIKIFCIIGNVENKHCIIIDDIIDSGNSLLELINFLYFNKIKSVKAYITHAIFSKNSYNKFINSNLKELIIMDTIKFNKKIKNIRVISTKFIFIEEIKKNILEENEV